MTSYYPLLAEARRNVLLKEYLDVNLKQAGFIDMTIEKTPLGTRLNVLALRPGLVIGPHGSSIRALMEDISKETSWRSRTRLWTPRPLPLGYLMHSRRGWLSGEQLRGL